MAHQTRMQDHQQIYTWMATTRNPIPHTKHVSTTALPLLQATSRDNQSLFLMPPPTMTTNMGGTHQPNPMAILPTPTNTSSARSCDTRTSISDNKTNTAANKWSHPHNPLRQTTNHGMETVDIQMLCTTMDYRNQPTRTAHQWTQLHYQDHLPNMAKSNSTMENAQLTPSSSKAWNHTTDITWSTTTPTPGRYDRTHWYQPANGKTNQDHPTVHHTKPQPHQRLQPSSC